MKRNKKIKNDPSIQDSIIMDFTKLSTKQILKLIFAGLFTIVVVIAFIQNFDSIVVEFLFWDFNISIALLILISVFVGGIINFFREERKVHKKNEIINTLQTRIIVLEKDISKEESLNKTKPTK